MVVLREEDTSSSLWWCKEGPLLLFILVSSCCGEETRVSSGNAEVWGRRREGLDLEVGFSLEALFIEGKGIEPVDYGEGSALC